LLAPRPNSSQTPKPQGETRPWAGKIFPWLFSSNVQSKNQKTPSPVGPFGSKILFFAGARVPPPQPGAAVLKMGAVFVAENSLSGFSLPPSSFSGEEHPANSAKTSGKKQATFGPLFFSFPSHPQTAAQIEDLPLLVSRPPPPRHKGFMASFKPPRQASGPVFPTYSPGHLPRTKFSHPLGPAPSGRKNLVQPNPMGKNV